MNIVEAVMDPNGECPTCHQRLHVAPEARAGDCDVRHNFESWYTDNAMPLEADWFKRDPEFPDLYAHDATGHAWDGWRGALGINIEEFDDREIERLTTKATQNDDDERCESGDPECGPVEFHDSEGVPLCRVCWEGLLIDSATDEDTP